MKHQIKQVFSSSKFVIGFVIFMIMLLSAIVYPLLTPHAPLDLVGTGFHKPGTYYQLNDTLDTTGVQLNIEPNLEDRLSKKLTDENKDKMKSWLVKFGGIEETQINTNNATELMDMWKENYDPQNPQKGLLTADKKAYVRLNGELNTILSASETIIAEKGEDGELIESRVIGKQEYVLGSEVAGKVSFPLGTDNFGRDVASELTSAIGVSLRIGLIAGLIATAIGLTLGLLSGYLGGTADNIIVFITNIFTVIPSFVVLILIANSVGQAARGPSVVAMIIGFTAWPWTCRSVRSQVISLRNRDHVNLSKLSGHSMPRIVIFDILPYVASYVVMALILQISSGILAEAQLSMLGLGPSTAEVTTLGLMMNWAIQFAAHISGAWWSFVPVILSIALISFSLNLMNTGLDQIFNPQLRDS